MHAIEHPGTFTSWDSSLANATCLLADESHPIPPPLPSPACSSPSVPPAKGKMRPTALPRDSVDVDVQIAYQVIIQPVIPRGRPIHPSIHPSLSNSSRASAFSQEGGKLQASHTGRARNFGAKHERPYGTPPDFLFPACGLTCPPSLSSLHLHWDWTTPPFY